MLKQVKKAIFNIAPQSWQRRFILRKTGQVTLTNEAIDGVTVTMSISPGKLWEKRLSEKGGHEPGICLWFKKNLKSDDVLFDIGTLFGFFPAMANAMEPTVKVHCFEMSWFAASFLKRNSEYNAKHNGSAPWVINEIMVTDKDAQNEVRIDSYISRNKIAPTVIKMDIDGGEVDAMKGMRQLIEDRKTKWVIEIHPAILASRSQSFEDLLKLIPADYSITYLPLIREDNLDWTTDYSSFDHKEEFYACIMPPEKK